MKVAVEGPKDVPLHDQAVLHLPSSMVFIPKAEADGLMKAWGNSVDDSFWGIVVSKGEEAWVITVNYTDEGYVEDSEAAGWNSDEMLQSIKEGTQQQNEERVAQGIPALDIVGWIQKPSYDASTHRLVWSILGEERGAAKGTAAVVNYNTYALGRDGYFELDLLTDSEHVDQDKQSAKSLLATLDYNKGKRYEEYVASTDKLATYGIAALVGGVVAKKLGLIALMLAFGAKFIKLILVGLAVAGGAIAKLFKRGGNS